MNQGAPLRLTTTCGCRQYFPYSRPGAAARRGALTNHGSDMVVFSHKGFRFHLIRASSGFTRSRAVDIFVNNVPCRDANIFSNQAADDRTIVTKLNYSLKSWS
jgi:hypothetical protein